MQKLTIVYLVSTLGRAGPTAQLYNIIRHLDEDRFRPVVLTLSPEPEESMRSMFATLDIPVHSLSLARWHSFIHHDWAKIVMQAAGCRFDGYTILHSQGIRADLISANIRADIPRVATVRNYPYDDYVMKYGALRGKWMARKHLAAMRAIPSLVACSSSLAGVLTAHDVKASVILNGVDTSLFTPAHAEERSVLRSELRLRANRLAAVSVGALLDRKDPTTIIDAVLSRAELNLDLLFVGSGPLERTCREAAGDDPRIRFYGHQEDVTRHLRAADLLVSASRSEGLPNSVLEALSSGLRVVLSDIEPHIEILRRLPFAGRSFKTGKAEDLAAALSKETGQSSCFGESERHRIEEELGAGRMSREYQALYATVLGDHETV